MVIGRLLKGCMAFAAVAVASGCAVYSTPGGEVIAPAPVVVAPAPAVVISPFGFYGGYRYYGPRGYYPRPYPMPRYYGRPYHRF